MDPLRACLLDLLYELRDDQVPLTVGGGFGLFLKRLHLDKNKTRTLYTELPQPRATNDIDLFLRADVLVDRTKIEKLVEAIKRLNYEPVQEAKYFQWRRSIDVGGVPQFVKLDALVGPLGQHRTGLKVSPPRVRPKGKSVEFHAHETEEALFLDEQPVAIELEGKRLNGELYKAVVYVPDAFPYLQMKLSAFWDRKEDADKDLGRHHAIDAYTIVGMMTENEYERAKELAKRSRDNQHYRRVCKIVSEDFVEDSSTGLIRMREHNLFRPSFKLQTFREVLAEIFSV